MEVGILGIRHHGVGSAINVLKYLEEFKPEHIIIEAPVELMDSFDGVDLEEFKPPVAILAYDTKEPSSSYFYPFADYSAEWQGIKYAKANGLSYSVADMPLKHIFAMDRDDKDEESQAPLELHKSPLDEIAKLEGYESADEWWDRYFEESYYQDASSHFQAILDVMSSLRERYCNYDFAHNNQREAFMREELRKAKREKKSRVVFICGAWHAPALVDFAKMNKEDKALITKLPKTKVDSVWIPWSNQRLSWSSGYGAGINSAGWYEHLWRYQKDDGKEWLIKVAKIFRKRDIDISTAHVIESYHLATALASLRGRDRAGLSELNQAVVSVMCMGDEILLDFITKELIVADKMGSVPSSSKKLPLQKDFEAKAKTYRLALREDAKVYKLDLRTPRGLEKSTFLHRLDILGIEWGRVLRSSSKGTFKEEWELSWTPELELNIIDRAIYGNTIEEATKNYINTKAKNSSDIVEVISLLELAILAKLFDSVDTLIEQIDRLSTQSYEVEVLIKSVIPLIKIARYSDVRNSDEVYIGTLIENMLYTIVASLNKACYGLSVESSTTMFELIVSLNDSLAILDDEKFFTEWFDTLDELSTIEEVSSLIRGGVYRILLDADIYDIAKVELGLSQALSVGNEALDCAYWIEGFLNTSATVLLVDDVIFNLIYVWLDGLDDEAFDALLPLLRRTFAKFSPYERAKIGAKAKRGVASTSQEFSKMDYSNFDIELAKKAIQKSRRRLYGLN
jgi:hypothetical protein